MLEFAICDECDKTREQLAQITNRIISTNQYDAKITFMSAQPREVIKLMEERVDRFFCIITEVCFNGSVDCGIEFGKQVRSISRNCHLVFVTQQSQSMLLVLNKMLRPSGFYIKPLPESEFEMLIADIYRDYLNTLPKLDSFYVNIGTTVYRISFDSILYFEAYDKKIYIYTENQRIGYYDSLSNIERKLGEEFIRCNKSFILNKNKVKYVSITDMMIGMENDAKINITRTYKPMIKEIFYNIYT